MNLLLSLEETASNVYIIEHVNMKSNTKEVINSKDLKDFVFYEKTGNKYYKKYREISHDKVIEEMITADVGFPSNTTDHGETTSDNYAPGDARNLFGAPDKTSKKKKKKRKQDDDGEKLRVKNPKFPMARRPFPEKIIDVK